jgi:DNA-binding transcriptional regulator YiaG
MEMEMAREEDRMKFVKLASARVSKALKDIQLIGNLANKSNYDYTDDDVTKIFRALNEEISACRKRFELSNKKGGAAKFTLE